MHRLPMRLQELFCKSTEQDEKSWTGPFTFVHAADPQLGLIEKHILKKSNPGWNVDLVHLKCAIRMINEIRPKPKFLVIGGDMVDTPPYEDVLDIHLGQYKDFRGCFEDLDAEIKLICVCGNHDVGDVPTVTTMDVYRNEFGQDYFSFWQGGVKFTVLNSQYFKCPEALPMNTCFQNDFIQYIADNTCVHHVIFQHIPFFIEHPDEVDISFLNINNSIRQDLLSQISEAGVGYMFYGHTHRNGLSKFRETEQILTAAIGGTFDETMSGFRVVYVEEKGISHEYIPLQIQFKELGNCDNLDEKLSEKENSE